MLEIATLLGSIGTALTGIAAIAAVMINKRRSTGDSRDSSE
ncbi:hypothetical protein AB0L56_19215 [Streptomyces sp. NPDC052079]